MPASRDPNIKKHSAKKLRWFAERFIEEAAESRKRADDYEAKAARYVKRAAILEAKDTTHGS